MEKTGWKTLAIVFISLFVLETIFGVWITSIGMNVINNEKECSNNICGEQIYDSYYYDEYKQVCTCFINHEPIITRYLK